MAHLASFSAIKTPGMHFFHATADFRKNIYSAKSISPLLFKSVAYIISNEILSKLSLNSPSLGPNPNNASELDPLGAK